MVWPRYQAGDHVKSKSRNATSTACILIHGALFFFQHVGFESSFSVLFLFTAAATTPQPFFGAWLVSGADVVAESEPPHGLVAQGGQFEGREICSDHVS